MQIDNLAKFAVKRKSLLAFRSEYPHLISREFGYQSHRDGNSGDEIID